MISVLIYYAARVLKKNKSKKRYKSIKRMSLEAQLEAIKNSALHEIEVSFRSYLDGQFEAMAESRERFFDHLVSYKELIKYRQDDEVKDLPDSTMLFLCTHLSNMNLEQSREQSREELKREFELFIRGQINDLERKDGARDESTNHIVRFEKMYNEL